MCMWGTLWSIGAAGTIGSDPWMGMAGPLTKFLRNIRKLSATCRPAYFFSWTCIRTASAGRILVSIWLTIISSIGPTARTIRVRWFHSRTAMWSIIGGGTRARSRLIHRLTTIIAILRPETRIYTGFASERRCAIKELEFRCTGLPLIGEAGHNPYCYWGIFRQKMYWHGTVLFCILRRFLIMKHNRYW